MVNWVLDYSLLTQPGSYYNGGYYMASTYPNFGPTGYGSPNHGYLPYQPGLQSFPARKRKNPLPALIITLLIFAVGFGILRYFSPILVAQSFMNDVYTYKFSDAINLVYPSEQSQAQAEFQATSYRYSI